MQQLANDFLREIKSQLQLALELAYRDILVNGAVLGRLQNLQGLRVDSIGDLAQVRPISLREDLFGGVDRD